MNRLNSTRMVCVVNSLFIVLAWSCACCAQSGTTDSSGESQSLSDRILSNRDLPLVLEQARGILEQGLNAGSGYAEVWIRDLNTFIELALDTSDQQRSRRT